LSRWFTSGGPRPHRSEIRKGGSARPASRRSGGTERIRESRTWARLASHRHPRRRWPGAVFGGFSNRWPAAAAGEHHGPGPQPAHLQAIRELADPGSRAPRSTQSFRASRPWRLLPAAGAAGLPLEGVTRASVRVRSWAVQHPAVAVAALRMVVLRTSMLRSKTQCTSAASAPHRPGALNERAAQRRGSQRTGTGP